MEEAWLSRKVLGLSCEVGLGLGQAPLALGPVLLAGAGLSQPSQPRVQCHCSSAGFGEGTQGLLSIWVSPVKPHLLLLTL